MSAQLAPTPSTLDVVWEVLMSVMGTDHGEQAIATALDRAGLNQVPNGGAPLEDFIVGPLAFQLRVLVGNVVASELTRQLWERFETDRPPKSGSERPPIVVILLSTNAHRRAQLEAGLGRLVHVVQTLHGLHRALESIRRPVVVFDGHSPSITRSVLVRSGLRGGSFVAWGVLKSECSSWELGVGEDMPVAVLPEPTTWQHLVSFLKNAERA